eukprot:7886491-Alexandrium_andersonii.AAC.1
MHLEVDLASLPKKQAKFIEALQQAVAAGNVDTRSNLAYKFKTTIEASDEMKASYRDLRSDKQRAEFRLEWARKELMAY